MQATKPTTGSDDHAAGDHVEGRERRLRIAFLVTRLHGGGAERQMLLLARELRASHDVQFLLLRPGGLFGRAPAELGLKVYDLGWREGRWRDAPVRYLLSGVRAVVRYVRLARQVDIIEARLPLTYIFAGFTQPLVRRAGLIAGRRVMSDNPALVSGPVRRLASALAMRQVDAVVANSEAVARDAIEVEGLSTSKVRVIRNGIDVPAPGPTKRRNELRQSLGIREEQLLVGCVANCVRGKGLEAVIATAARLRSEAPHLRFLLVGYGPLEATVQQRIIALGVGDLVTLHGAHPDAQRLYSAFDIVVQASESEGMPNAILEAAAWGKPIVATDVGGTREIVRHRREALLVPARDEEALARAILQVVRNPGLGKQLGAAARERAYEFSPKRLATETARLYMEVASSRRRRTSRSPSGARDTRQPSA